MPPTADLSPLALVLHADPVVQAVMLLLLLASLACWAVIIEKTVLFRRLGAEARALSAASAPAGPAPPQDGLAAGVLRAGQAEWREGRDHGETAGEFRARLEATMRAAAAPSLRAAEPGLPLLATIGSVSPFLGLFGTVWGIMHSFGAIAARQDTSLATVAPGIAEALFATAIGLAAAIPATIAYNRCAVRLGRIRTEIAAAAGTLAAGLARRPAVITGGRAAAAE